MRNKAYVVFECGTSCCCPKEVLSLFEDKKRAIEYVKMLGDKAKDRLGGEYNILLDTPFIVDGDGDISEITYVYGKKTNDPKYRGSHKYPGYFTRSYVFEIEEFEIN